MISTLKTFGQKILYGFGFGGGMGLAYANIHLFRIDLQKEVKNYTKTDELNIFNIDNKNSKK
jgi:hypothetical protein